MEEEGVREIAFSTVGAIDVKAHGQFSALFVELKSLDQSTFTRVIPVQSNAHNTTMTYLIVHYLLMYPVGVRKVLTNNGPFRKSLLLSFTSSPIPHKLQDLT